MIRANEIWNPVDRLLTDLENSDGILSAIFPISFQNISSVESVSVLKLLHQKEGSSLWIDLTWLRLLT